MSLENGLKYLEEKGFRDRVTLFDVSSATVELAAAALGTEPGKIAKSLTFMVDEKPIMILFEGSARVDNKKYKALFGTKAKMLKFEEVEELVGHPVGGVCPFGIKEGVKVYLDESLKRHETVYPAAGSGASAVRVNIDEFAMLLPEAEWIDVSKFE